jgi:hypothetical protein
MLGDTKQVLSALDEMRALYDGLIDDAKLTDQQRLWVRTRWRTETLSMYRLSGRLRTRFTWVRIIAIFSSLVTPVFAGIGFTNGPVSAWSRGITVGFGVIAAAAVAIDQIMRDGVRWRLYRSVFNILNREGWSFFNCEGDYADRTDEGRFSLFFTNVEQAIHDREEAYRHEVAGVVDQALPKS